MKDRRLDLMVFCRLCGCSVAREDQQVHTDQHAALEGMARAIVDLQAAVVAMDARITAQQTVMHELFQAAR